ASGTSRWPRPGRGYARQNGPIDHRFRRRDRAGATAHRRDAVAQWNHGEAMILNYFNNPTILVIVSIIMVMALIFHNMVQAYVASRLGDQSPRLAGFLTFDPQRHLEPMGVVFLLLLGFGWPRS